jgi:HEAT repeat protein
MKRRRLVICAATVICLVAVIVVVRKSPGRFASSNNKSLEILCARAYSGNPQAVAQLAGADTNVIPGLVELLRTRDSFFRKQAWLLLRKLPPPLRRSLAPRFPPPAAEYVRETAAHGLGLLGPLAREAIPDLIRALRDREGRVSVEAAGTLSRIGPAALPALNAALHDHDARVRQAVINALTQMNPETRLALPGLVQKLDDPDERVRSSAAYALTTMGLPGTFALIGVADRGNTDAGNAASNMLASSYLTIRSAESALYLMTQDASPARRLRAVKALARIPAAGDLAVDTAIHLLEDPAEEVRLGAIEALGAMGSRSRSGVPQLVQLTASAPESIRIAARQAIEKIETQKRIP